MNQIIPITKKTEKQESSNNYISERNKNNDKISKQIQQKNEELKSITLESNLAEQQYDKQLNMFDLADNKIIKREEELENTLGNKYDIKKDLYTHEDYKNYKIVKENIKSIENKYFDLMGRKFILEDEIKELNRLQAESRINEKNRHYYDIIQTTKNNIIEIKNKITNIESLPEIIKKINNNFNMDIFDVDSQKIENPSYRDIASAYERMASVHYGTSLDVDKKSDYFNKLEKLYSSFNGANIYTKDVNKLKKLSKEVFIKDYNFTTKKYYDLHTETLPLKIALNNITTKIYSNLPEFFGMSLEGILTNPKFSNYIIDNNIDLKQEFNQLFKHLKKEKAMDKNMYTTTHNNNVGNEIIVTNKNDKTQLIDAINSLPSQEQNYSINDKPIIKGHIITSVYVSTNRPIALS